MRRNQKISVQGEGAEGKPFSLEGSISKPFDPYGDHTIGISSNGKEYTYRPRARELYYGSRMVAIRCDIASSSAQ